MTEGIVVFPNEACSALREPVDSAGIVISGDGKVIEVLEEVAEFGEVQGLGGAGVGAEVVRLVKVIEVLGAGENDDGELADLGLGAEPLEQFEAADLG